MIEETLKEIEQENKKNTNEMGIFQKLTYIQNDLLEIPIPKNGKNKFGGFTYYELEDLLPPILRLCKKYGCALYFNFPVVDGECHKGVLNLINWNDKHDCIKVEVPLPQLEKLPKMNYAQVSGTYQTYMKRYLILHTFDIVEKEVIDSGVLEENGKKQSTQTKKPVTEKKTPIKNKTEEKKKQDSVKEKQEKATTKTSVKTVEKPAILDKVIQRCHELHSERECNGKLINRVSLDMFKNKEITLDERKAVFNYIKTNK